MPVLTADVDGEYAKYPRLRRDDVQTLVEWARRQPHLPTVDELLAILFLHSCHFSNEAAKVALDTHFTVRTLCPEIFLGRNPLSAPMRSIADVVVYTPLPKQTPEGHTVLFCRIVDGDPDHYHFAPALRLFDMVTSLHLHQSGTSEGVRIVLDMQGIVFGHLTRLGPLLMKKFLFYLQEGLPVRLCGLHYVNVVSFMDRILALMRPFMKKELMDMLHLHTSVEELFSFVPQDCLPKDYCGSADSLSALQDQMKQNLVDNVEFFAAEDRQLVDEAQRPGKPKNVGDVFGVEGTFKKLDID